MRIADVTKRTKAAERRDHRGGVEILRFGRTPVVANCHIFYCMRRAINADGAEQRSSRRVDDCRAATAIKKQPQNVTSLTGTVYTESPDEDHGPPSAQPSRRNIWLTCNERHFIGPGHVTFVGRPSHLHGAPLQSVSLSVCLSVCHFQLVTQQRTTNRKHSESSNLHHAAILNSA